MIYIYIYLMIWLMMVNDGSWLMMVGNDIYIYILGGGSASLTVRTKMGLGTIYKFCGVIWNILL